MLIYEFDLQEPLVTQIVAVTDQLKADLEDEDVNFYWDVDTLLSYFKKYGINLDRKALISMSQKDPLKKVIKGIEGNNVIFVGQQELETPPGSSEDSKKVVANMAKKALK